jgi:two-component system OmpR family response regulator
MLPFSMRVLIVEDGPTTAALVRHALVGAGMLVDTAVSGEDAVWMAQSAPYAVICLDVNLPGIDGFETCRRLRAADVRTPVLMLTARAAVGDRITGLNTGADDYLTKPFDAGELLARVNALARRPPALVAEVLRVGDLTLDRATHRVARGDTEIELSVKQVQLLDVFMSNAGRVLTRADLLDGAWDGLSDHRSNAIDAQVKLLRRRIDRPFGRDSIETIRGAGYRFRAD